MSTTFDSMAARIIKEQELIVGPIAWQEAGKVQGLHIGDVSQRAVTVENDGNGPLVIDRLVGQYEHLFGRASREVCREAVASLLAELTPSQIPLSLR